MAVERNRRAPVLDLSRPTGVQVEIDVAEAAEVLMSICAIAHPEDHDTFDLGAEWLQARLETVPDDLREDVMALRLGDMKLAAHLLGIVWETPRPRTFAAFAERLAATDATEIKLHLYGHYDTTSQHLPAEIVEAAARGDRDAIERVLAELAEFSDKHDLYRDLLELDSGELKARLLDILPRWHREVFAPHEPEWRRAAERDAEAKRALLSRHSPEQMVELATRGYQYAPPPAIRTIAFFPSWFMRPWVILWEHKSTKIFCYPIAPAGDEGTPLAEVARVYKALGDEGRLKLLRRLSDGPVKLSEAAAELGVAKSTAHHHLAILRQAGFVTIRDGDENVYTLRRDLLPQAGDLLAAYLGSSSRSSATRP
jgi:DNA-binding transcriptional ArsR family regulator